MAGLRDAQGNPITTDVATKIAQVPLPQPTGAAPQGITEDMLDFFDKRVDDKIRASIHGLHIRTREQAEEDYRKEFRNRVFWGLGGLALGIGGSMLYRRLTRGDDDYEDDDGDDMNE